MPQRVAFLIVMTNICLLLHLTRIGYFQGNMRQWRVSPFLLLGELQNTPKEKYKIVGPDARERIDEETVRMKQNFN